MAKVWSFNTTIRNPERMENMLRALSELEGIEFDLRGQESFFGLQIKKRLYKPTKKTLEDSDLIQAVHCDITGDDIDDSLVERILQKYRGKSVDGSGRGRTSAGVLNRFGLCVALISRGPIVITSLAKSWLNHEIEDEELFSKFFLKWQYPNQIEAGYDDFDIKPFVGVLSLIRGVNNKWKSLGNTPVGLSRHEYQLFATSLSSFSQIEDYVARIIKYRTKKESLSGQEKSGFIKLFNERRVREIYGDRADLKKSLADLKDYTDSSIRYFRVSGLISLRGRDTHIDISQDKEIEVDSILEKIPPCAEVFQSYEEYFAYLNDISAPDLPWQNEDDLQRVSKQLSLAIRSEDEGDNLDAYFLETEALSAQDKVKEFEDRLNEIRINKLRDLRYNVSVLDECIERIRNITSNNYEPLTTRPSLDLEWYVSRALMVINDAEEILPSFKVGDDGIPTGFRSNISDIECYYQSFGMTVEVTLLSGRDQWYAEGNPVMRHFRDFEDKAKKGAAFCLFLAPFIHRDTLNSFWVSNKYGYEGKTQKIIPLTVAQFINILLAARTKICGKRISHESLHGLFSSISASINNFEISHEWVSTFPAIISRW